MGHATAQQCQDDPVLLRHRRGNDAVDEAAKLANECHPEAPDWLKARLRRDLKAVQVFCKLAEHLLPLWPRVPRPEIEAAARAASLRRVPLERQLLDRHSFLDLGTHWQCWKCLVVRRTHASRARARGEACHGVDRQVLEAVLKPRGHLLCLAVRRHEAPFLFCARCGAYSEERVRSLAKVCQGPTVRGTYNLAALQAGRHPLEPIGTTSVVDVHAAAERPEGRLFPTVGPLEAQGWVQQAGRCVAPPRGPLVEHQEF